MADARFHRTGLTAGGGGALAGLFHVTAWTCYALLYLAPVPLLGALALRLFPAASWLPGVVVVVASTLILLALQADLLVYQLFEFHLNGFVWNLLTTPGGLASLGSSRSTYESVVMMITLTGALQVLNLWIARQGLLFCLQQLRTWRWALGLGSILFITQGVVYGISDLSKVGAVLDNSKAYPLFQRVRFRSLAGRLRHDQLSPETMPNTWQFAGQNLHFRQHYSSGNGTREAVFGLFYGLYGSYWEAFLHARQPPLLMDRLQELDYQLDLRTGATFTYPEFDKTVFTTVPPDLLHEASAALPAWQRDQRNMDALLGFLQQRDPARPFFSFLFFESTHASYAFPEEQALLPDYSRDVDFTQLHSLGSEVDAGPLLSRYRNAGYWIDQQLGRLYRALEEQTHVPMVVHFPGRGPEHIDRLSSHLDVAPLLLQTLGLETPLSQVSLGENLLAESPRRAMVMSDWHRLRHCWLATAK